MANPNIVNVTSILGKTDTFALTTSTGITLVRNDGDSGKIYKINSIVVTNIDGSSAANLTMSHVDEASTSTAIASTISVPADSSLVLIDKNSSFYLEEGHEIQGGASANGDLVCLISYEIIS